MLADFFEIFNYLNLLTNLTIGRFVNKISFSIFDKIISECYSTLSFLKTHVLETQELGK